MSADYWDRFWAKVDFSGDCWEWTACTKNGYGKFGRTGGTQIAHRIAYELLVGPVPSEITLDHLCRNRPCVNPDHLEPTTRGDNVLRSHASLPGQNRRKTHCPRGHELTGDNLYDTASGYRMCKTCHREVYHQHKTPFSEARQCLACGTAFEATTPRNQYCSIRCYQRTWKRNSRAKARMEAAA